MMQAYINAGDFKFTKRIKSAFHVNIRFYLIYVVVGFFGLIYLIAGNGYTRPRIQDFVMAMANSWGLLLVIVFMGYGLVDGPRKLWFSGNVKRRLHQLYAKASRVKEECIDSELEFKDLAKHIRVKPATGDEYCLPPNISQRYQFTWIGGSNCAKVSFCSTTRVQHSRQQYCHSKNRDRRILSQVE
ncbi:LMBR1 domain-containing protein 2 [Apophysomyces sp. BC1015]|nr:LMBR1 domain-containing protein 2 [Apophysomyces sp. BC1015]